MDGWLLWMCVFLSRLPSKKTVNTSLLCLTPVHLSDVFLYPTVRPFDTLFISVSLSLSPSPTFLRLPHPLSSRLSPTFSSHSLIYYSHPLADSFFLSHDTWNPSVRCRAFRPPTKSASLSGKGTRWWIKEQSKETDKKLQPHCIGWHLTHSFCVILLEDRFQPCKIQWGREVEAKWKNDIPSLVFWCCGTSAGDDIPHVIRSLPRLLYLRFSSLF